MADLMDRGFATARALHLSPWTSPRIPPSARYAAANFVPGTAIPDVPRVGQVVRAEPAKNSLRSTSTIRVASNDATVPAETTPPVGSWVIQVGSFSDMRSAERALQQATSILSDLMRTDGAATTIDEVTMAQKTFHRARVTNLSQADAVDGCKRLAQHKVYCAALEVTAWNTEGAR